MTLGDHVRAGLISGGVRKDRISDADAYVRDGRIAVVDGRVAAFISGGAAIVDPQTNGAVLVDPVRYARLFLRKEKPEFFADDRREPSLPGSLSELKASGKNLTELLAAVGREQPVPIAIPEHWAKDSLSARIIAEKNVALKA